MQRAAQIDGWVAAAGLLHLVLIARQCGDAYDRCSIDGLPFDELHHHVGPAVGCNPNVIKFGNSRMIEVSQALTLNLKALDFGDGR